MKNISKSILKALEIEHSEQTQVFLFALQSFFLGIFYATFDISASALFLSVYPSAMLPKAFLVSGIAGMILTFTFSKLQAKIPFSKLIIINLIFITILTTILRIGFDVYSSKWLIFLIFILMGPLNILGILGFWGMAGRMFTLRQGKRLFGMLDSGQIFGKLVISFAVPVLLIILSNTKNIMYVSAFSTFIATIIQLVITKKFHKIIDAEVQADNKDNNHVENQNVGAFFKQRYIRLMAAFIVLSMLSAFFVYYSFLCVTNTKYPDNTELTKFLGLFTGTLMIFSFTFKTFVYNKLIKTYGINICLMILPVLLGFFTILAVISGYLGGISVEKQGFVFFFLLIALSRLFSVTLKDSIEAPTFKILYQSIDVKVRSRIQAILDGSVNEFAAVFSGLLLTILGFFAFINLIHYSLVLFVLIVSWFFIIIMLYKEYKNSLKHSLSKSSNENIGEQGSFKNIIKKEIDKVNSDKAINIVKVVEKIEPLWHDELVNELIYKNSETLRDFSLNKIREINYYQIKDNIDKKQNIDSRINILIKEFEEDVNSYSSKEKIKSLANSKNSSDRAKAARLIGYLNKDENTHLLVPLLRDTSHNVRIASIKAAALLKKHEFCPLLIDNLSSTQYYNYALSSLVEIGEKSLELLEQNFNKSDMEDIELVRTIKIYGNIGGEKASKLLISKVNFHNRDVIIESLKSLKSCGFEKTEENIRKIKEVVKLTIANITWNLNITNNLSLIPDNELLTEAFQEELKGNYNLIFLLLSLIYDSQSIVQIRESIESEIPEKISFAIELLDLFVDEELKPILFPLFEDISIDEKLHQLQEFFPIDNYEALDLLNAIINRDNNYINRWTKALALYSYNNTEVDVVPDDIISHLFNKDQILKELAALFIYKNNFNLFEECGKRLNNKVKAELDKTIKKSYQNKYQLILERVFFLKKMKQFEKIASDILIEIAENFTLMQFEKDFELITKNNCATSPYYFIIEGSIILSNSENILYKYYENEFIGEMSFLYSDDNNTIMKTAEPTMCFKIEKDIIDELIYNHKSLARIILNMSNDRFVS